MSERLESLLPPCARDGGYDDWWGSQHVHCTGSHHIGSDQVWCTCSCHTTPATTTITQEAAWGTHSTHSISDLLSDLGEPKVSKDGEPLTPLTQLCLHLYGLYAEIARLMAASARNDVEMQRLRDEVKAAKGEVNRLSAWLGMIEHSACEDPDTLRRCARTARAGETAPR